MVVAPKYTHDESDASSPAMRLHTVAQAEKLTALGYPYPVSGDHTARAYGRHAALLGAALAAHVEEAGWQ